MAVVVRRYSFIGPSNIDLSRFVGNGAAQSALFPVPVVVDISIDNAVAGATTTLDEMMNQIGWVYDPTASDPPLKVQDEGISTGVRRATMNFIGAGVGAVDNPGGNRVDVTIPGAVSLSQYVAAAVSTSSATFVDGLAGLSIAVPINGDYFILFEGEGRNQNSTSLLEIALSNNSLVAALADSPRSFNGAASDLHAVVTSKTETGLIAGDLIRVLLRKPSGSGTVELVRRRLTIIKVQ